jgi:periplasmic divalent cation tolerance protein
VERDGHVVIMTTAGSREEARRLARGLVEGRLAACVQMVPVESVYEWDGEVREDAEILLLAKTRRDRYADVETHLRAHHSYDIPEIVAVPVEAGLAAYLGWVDRQTEGAE